MSEHKLIALDHVEITTQEPEKAAEFYARVYGLKQMASAGGVISMSCQPLGTTTSSSGELLIKEGPTAVRRIAFSTDDKSKVDVIATSSVHDVEICLPTERVDRGTSQAPFGISKLGHVTFKDPDPTRLKNFYTDTLKLNLSDSIGDRFYWLRCNEDHHNVGVSFSKTAGTHHIAYELENWEAVKHLCDHLRDVNVPVEFGPGRHGPGNNIFVYVQDPFGFRFEFFTELQVIKDDAAHEARNWAGGRMKNANTWGWKPPESFINEE